MTYKHLGAIVTMIQGVAREGRSTTKGVLKCNALNPYSEYYLSFLSWAFLYSSFSIASGQEILLRMGLPFWLVYRSRYLDLLYSVSYWVGSFLSCGSLVPLFGHPSPNSSELLGGNQKSNNPLPSRRWWGRIGVCLSPLGYRLSSPFCRPCLGVAFC